MNAIASTSEVSALLAAFTRTSTSIISDCLDRLPGARLKPFHRIEGTMAGIALTVKVPCGDNRAIHQALEILTPGQVLVVDGGGDISRALMGDIMGGDCRKTWCCGRSGGRRDSGSGNHRQGDIPDVRPRRIPSRPLQKRPWGNQRASQYRRHAGLAGGYRRGRS